MSEEIRISSVVLSDGNTYGFFDKEGVHCKVTEDGGIIWITGDPVIDAKIMNEGLHIVEYEGEEIDNLLTLKEGRIQTRSIEYIYKDIGGKNNEVNNAGVMSIGTPEVKSPED